MIRPNENDEIYDKDDDGEPDLTSAAAAAAAVRSSSHHRLSHLYTVHRTQRRRQQTVLVVVVVASVVVGVGRQSRRVGRLDDCWPIDRPTLAPTSSSSHDHSPPPRRSRHLVADGNQLPSAEDRADPV